MSINNYAFVFVYIKNYKGEKLYSILRRNMERRRGHTKTTLAFRIKFVWLWIAGMSVRDIAKATGTSSTTVYRWLRRWQNNGIICKRRSRHKSRILPRGDTGALPPAGVPFRNVDLPLYCYPNIYSIPFGILQYNIPYTSPSPFQCLKQLQLTYSLQHM